MHKIIKTIPYIDQEMGTAGLRKKYTIFSQENYVENFVQSIFDSIGGVEGKTYIIGGDGRYYNDEIVQKVIKLSAGNGVKKLFLGKNGFLATPVGSKLIMEKKLDGGIVLTASHNSGGKTGDVGIKYSNQTGGQAPKIITDRIYENTKKISEYKVFEAGFFDSSKPGVYKYGDMKIEVIDTIDDYLKMLEEIFDFPAIKTLFQTGFEMCFDAMNAITGPYAIRIFEEVLGAKKGSVINSIPLPDFGGLHPDPNLKHAKQLINIMSGEDAPDFGAAADGDGDRYMIVGRDFFVSPSDSIAIMTDNYKLVPYYKKGIYGAAKSAATSMALEKVAKSYGIDFYETPTGWKFFVNLMDSKRITFCGEESFGSGSNHIREKDGIWAVLFWLNIIAKQEKSVETITREHWEKYGRSYYLRHDFEEIKTDVANKLIKDLASKLPSLKGQKYKSFEVVEADAFTYVDPVEKTSNQDGYLIKFADQSRIMYRLSGTGSVGATLRIYVERYEKKDVNQEASEMIKDLYQYALEISEVLIRTGKKQADVIT